MTTFNVKPVTFKGKFVCSEYDLIYSYNKLGNVWKVGELYQIPGQKVHEILKRLGLNKPKNVFTDREKQILREKYLLLRDDGRLSELAAELGRTKYFICRQAKYLGLTDKDHRVIPGHVRIKMSENSKNYLLNNPHPKGMLNKKHSEETKQAFSIIVKKRWQDPSYVGNSKEYRKTLSKRMSNWQQTRTDKSNNYSRVKCGTIEIGGKIFFARSSWEANIAAYFEFLKKQNEIKDWLHEPETFWFNKIKRGVRSYLPDFKIINLDNSSHFVEVKGWMDDKSKTKIRRMALYYPNIKLQIIDEKRYKAIKKNCGVIPNWGLLDSGDYSPKKRICDIEGCTAIHLAKGFCRRHYLQIYKKS